jgi:hypothetical protein
MDENSMLGQAFKLVAKLLQKLEDCGEDWHLAPIWRHSKVNKLSPSIQQIFLASWQHRQDYFSGATLMILESPPT